MKFGIATALLSVASVATALSSSNPSACSPISIYSFPLNANNEITKSIINAEQGELLIAETLQASRFYKSRDILSADLMELSSGSDNILGGNTNAMVVILNGVDPLHDITFPIEPVALMEDRLSSCDMKRITKNVVKAGGLTTDTLEDAMNASGSNNIFVNIINGSKQDLEIVSDLIARASSDSPLVIITVPASVCASDEEKMENIESLFTIQQRDVKSAPRAVSNTTTPTTSPVPEFFASKKICEESTNSCSSHGTCVGSNSKFYCKCTSEFAGFACQKKDVSVQFQLFFWTTLAIVGVAVAGVSLLSSIGSEPLPGVLGKSE